MRRDLFAVACLLCAVAPSCAQIRFHPVDAETVRARLRLYKGTDAMREAALRTLFAEAGCPASGLSEQKVPGLKEPNLLCVLPGDTPGTIVVGAHFDHVVRGDGIADNWSGASLLPSLIQSLAVSGHRHTFIFAGFAGEELGEIGSGYFAEHLGKNDLGALRLMIAVDTVGLGPTKVWVSRSDKAGVEYLILTARALKLPLAGVNTDGFGSSDEEPFIRHGVKTVMIHSLTAENRYVLHSWRDAPNAIHFDDYYDTYRLLAGYLAVLDVQLDPAASGKPQAADADQPAKIPAPPAP